LMGEASIIMSKKNQNLGENHVDNISVSRYISHMQRTQNNFRPPAIKAEYVGSKGMLFRADCLDLLANIRENSVDMVFVDPPFNLGKDYKLPDFDDNMETETYRNWCRSWLLELARVLKPGGALFLYHMPKWLIDFGAWLNTLPTLTFKNWIALKMKSGFPIRNRLHPAHYGILYYVKKGGKPTFNVVRHMSPVCRHCGKLIRDYGGYRKKFDKFEDQNGVPWIQISDLWEDTRPARQDKSRELQVNELPVQIPERLILMATKPGDVVLDSFAGGGSTLHAAQLHERFWIGGEIAESNAALRRIGTLFGTEERATIPRQLGMTFTTTFRDYITEQQNGKRGKRPIIKAGRISGVTSSMYEAANKSKVLGY